MWIFALLFAFFPNAASITNECLESFYIRPLCVNDPTGYYCNCGPGFKWNSKSCIAAGVDSKMIFSATSTSYTIVRHQTMSTDFTISLWIRPKTVGVVLSMMGDKAPLDNTSILQITLHEYEDDRMSVVLEYRGHEWMVPNTPWKSGWNHIVWTQRFINRRSLKWVFYMNGEFQETRIETNALVLRGAFILGQFTTKIKTRSGNHGFSGDLAHVNIWNTSITANQIQDINRDCFYNYCGNVVQWANFRYGTHGNLLLQWPSGIKEQPCVNGTVLERSCDSACSLWIGAQCKMEISYNSQWQRVKAHTNVTLLCPMPEDLYLATDNSSELTDKRPSMTRYCAEGKWEAPNYKNCISSEWDRLMAKKVELEEQAKQCHLSNIALIEGLKLFANMTENIRISSAMELSVCIDILDALVFLKDKQEAVCPRFNIELADKKEDFLRNFYLLIKLVINIASNLLDQQNMAGWNYTRPSGFEGRKLLGIMHKFYEQTSANINNLINKFLYTPLQMCSLIQERNIIVKIRATRWSDFRGSSFPDFDDLLEMSEDWPGSSDKPTIVLINDFLPLGNRKDMTAAPIHVVVITAIYREAETKAIHAAWRQRYNRTGSVLSMSQKINSDILDIAVSVDSKIVDKILPQSLKINFKMKEHHNISNENCLVLAGDFRQGNIYANSRVKWVNSCQKSTVRKDSLVCVCDQLGIFSLATDMFNDNWKKQKPPNDLIALPSYFGCTVSALLVCLTLIMLVYLRTSSNTSAIHKHFSAAIVASQLCYMIGIDKYEQQYICWIFSLSLHYFVLSCFAWLMNEAFNLYIVITYAAHSHSDNIDGHMWRFYLLGWIMPGIVVAAIVGVNRADYFAPNMCWINQKDLWLFCGPPIVVIAVTILVLIFTAKEQHESSYTKNEKDNKAVVNQTKAIWTQIILLPLSWSFAFLVLRMQGIIVKYLFGLFVSLQGLFYVMFYYLLNDEVQKIYSERKRGSSERRHLEPPDESDQQYVSYNDAFPGESRTRRSSRRDDADEVSSQRQRGFFTNVIENLNIRSKRSIIGEESSDTNNNENSDYELITTV